MMKADDVHKVFDYISHMSLAERKKVKGLAKDRADIINAGINLYSTLLQWFHSDTLLTSNRGIRDGIMFERVLKLKEITHFNDMVMYSVEQFNTRFYVNVLHAKHVAMLADKIYEGLTLLDIIDLTEKERKILEVAALLHDIGRSINIYNIANHTFYLLTNVLLMGFTHRERLLTALIASFKNFKMMREKNRKYMDILSKEDEELIRKLGLILQLANTFDFSKQQSVKTIQIKRKKTKVVVECVGLENLLEYESAENLLKKYNKVFHNHFYLKINHEK